jgi:hypothetical protein
MKKDIKNYAHLFVGGQFVYRVGEYEWSEPMKFTADQLDVFYINVEDPNCHYRFILRPLSSMMEEEGKQIFGETFIRLVEGGTLYLSPNQTLTLLSKGFDLFGLIDSGLAVNAETLK